MKVYKKTLISKVINLIMLSLENRKRVLNKMNLTKKWKTVMKINLDKTIF